MESVKQFEIKVISDKWLTAESTQWLQAESKIFLWYDKEDAKKEAWLQWYQIISEDKDIKIVEYWSNSKPLFYSKKITKRDILLFFELFGNLEWLPPLKQIEILKKQAKKYIMVLFYNDLLHYTWKWKSLHSILEMPKWSKFFSHNQLELIKVWENTKNLNETIINLANEQKNELEIKASIIAASIYPIIVLVFIVISSLILFIFILPMVLNSVWDMEIAPLTQIIFDIRTFILDYWFITLGFLIIFIFTFLGVIKTYNWKLMVHKFLIICPWIKWLVKARVEMQISKILEFSSKAGMTPIMKISLLENWIDNLFYKEYFTSKANSINMWGKLVGVFLNDKLFSPQMQWYIETWDINKNLWKLMNVHYHTILKNIQHNIKLVETLITSLTILMLWIIVTIFAWWMFQLVLWLTDSVF